MSYLNEELDRSSKYAINTSNGTCDFPRSTTVSGCPIPKHPYTHVIN